MIDSPVLILGCPRSGTTLLYALLSGLPELWSIGSESKAIIEKFHHPSVKRWESGALLAEDLTAESRDYMLNAFIRQAAPGNFWQRVNRLRGWLAGNRFYRQLKRHGKSERAGSAASRSTPTTGLAVIRAFASLYGRRAAAGGKSIRLLEKTPENCLRLPFLQALFPDARIIYLYRDGLANIHSLMEGWQQPHLFPGYLVPVPVTIPGQTRGRWAFTLIPGWRDLVDRPLAEVCARQWVRTNEAVLGYLDQPGAMPAIRVRYEDLIRAPIDTLTRIAGFLSLDPAGMPLSPGGLPEINVITKPNADKWRTMGSDALRQIEPIITPMMVELGYREGSFDDLT